MKVFVVHFHPSNNSFTFVAKEEFLRGLPATHHECVVSDLYKMNFNPEL